MKSYIVFSSYGAFPEEFISELILCGERLRDISYGDGIIYATVAPRRYRRIARAARKHNVRTRVEERRGILFLINRYRKRWGLVCGALAFLLINLVLAQFIWDIRVEGNAIVSDGQIKSLLYENGIKPGVYVYDIDTDQTEYRALLSIDEISWLNIERRGSRVFAKLSERTITERNLAANIPCNVVAEREGVIVETEVYRGHLLKPTGSGVVPGDIIVTGAFDDGGGNNMLVQASAKIIAEYTETAEFFVPYSEEIKQKSGEVIGRDYLVLLGLEIPLFLSHDRPDGWGTSYETRLCNILGLPLPWKIKNESFSGYETITLNRSSADVLSELDFRIERYRESFYSDIEIMNEERDATISDDGIGLSVTFTLRGNIAKKQPISIKMP